MNWKEPIVAKSRSYPRTDMERMRKTMKHLLLNSRYPAWDSNRAHSVYTTLTVLPLWETIRYMYVTFKINKSLSGSVKQMKLLVWLGNIQTKDGISFFIKRHSVNIWARWMWRVVLMWNAISVCTLKLISSACYVSQTHTERQAARGPSRAQPTDRSPRRNISSLLKQFHDSSLSHTKTGYSLT
jgi:hypothetical protein